MGQTGNTFNERLRRHLTEIRNGTDMKPVSRHFTSDNPQRHHSNNYHIDNCIHQHKIEDRRGLDRDPTDKTILNGSQPKAMTKVYSCDSWEKSFVSSSTLNRHKIIWAASCQNQQNDCAPSEDSDQPGHPPSLIRVFTCAQCVAKDPSFLHADSEDSDQTERMPRLIWVFAGCTVTLLVLSRGGSFHTEEVTKFQCWHCHRKYTRKESVIKHSSFALHDPEKKFIVVKSTNSKSRPGTFRPPRWTPLFKARSRATGTIYKIRISTGTHSNFRPYKTDDYSDNYDD